MLGLDQNELKLVSLKEFDLLDAPDVPRAGPRQLRERRGVDPSLFASGGVFVDGVLGYAIARKDVLSRITKAKQQPPFSHMPRPYDNWTVEVDIDDEARSNDGNGNAENNGEGAGKSSSGINKSPPLSDSKSVGRNAAKAGDAIADAVPLSLPDSPWYLQDQQWPEELGTDVKVAVLDSGVQPHKQLKRHDDGSDFCSCAGPGTLRQDISSILHGTRCAGVVAAIGPQGRISPAPECDLLSACVMRKQQQPNNNSRITTSQADVLLMLSWAVEMGARVINMSITFKRLPDEEMKLLTDAVKNIREQDLALVFAAAKLDGEEVSQPGCLDKIVGVGEYSGGTKSQATTGNGLSWNKGELLFGPGSWVASVQVGTFPQFFTEPSAACAFTSGVAALYVQRYWDENSKGNVEKILQRMFADAKNLTEASGGKRRLAVQLPKPPKRDQAGVPAPLRQQRRQFTPGFPPPQ